MIFEELSVGLNPETSPLSFIRINMNLGATLREIGIMEDSINSQAFPTCVI
jgi:hypothetical protein